MRQRLQGFAHQVSDQVVDLVGVGGDAGKLRIGLEDDFGFGDAEVELAKLNQARNHVIEVDGFAMGGLFAREGEEIHDELGGAVAFVGGLLKVSAGLRAQVVVGKDEFEIAFDDRERIVEFLGDAGNHPANGREFFRLAKLLFQAGPLREFDDEKLIGGAAVEINQGAVDFNGNNGAVFAHEVHGTLAAEGEEPVFAVLRRRAGLAFDLAKRAEGMPAQFGTGDAQEAFGGAVQFEDAEIVGIGDENGFARLVEEFLVADLGGEDAGSERVTRDLASVGFFDDMVIGFTDFLEDEDDHADSEHELEAGRDKHGDAGKIFGAFEEGIAGHVNAPQGEAEGEQGCTDVFVFGAVFEKAPGGDAAGEGDEREDGNFHLQPAQVKETIRAHVTPNQKEHNEPAEHGLADALAEKAPAAPQQKNSRHTDAPLPEP